ncbi:MAG: hypothetical protein DCO96_06550 [Fluviicola sp. XM-24bin1]|nr:MAG: hypothetical protein DCO96_06550 [Fluviicola sp. XM-24bin1]
MKSIIELLDGTDHGQLKVRVFAFLHRLDNRRSIDQELLEQCVSRVFKCDTAIGVVADWVDQR